MVLWRSLAKLIHLRARPDSNLETKDIRQHWAVTVSHTLIYRLTLRISKSSPTSFVLYAFLLQCCNARKDAKDDCLKDMRVLVIEASL